MSALQEEITAAVQQAIAPLTDRIEELSRQIAVSNGDDQDRWISVKEAAGQVGRDEKTVRRWITDGLVETRRVGPNAGRLQILERSLTL